MVTNLGLVPGVVVLFSLLVLQQDAQESANGQRHEQEVVEPQSIDASRIEPAGVIGIRLGRDRTQPVVSSVIPGGPADVAGLKPGAVIVAVDDEPIEDIVEFMATIRAHKPGDTVAITLDSQEVFDVTLVSWRDLLNEKFKEFRVDGATRLSKATFCGLELANTPVPNNACFPSQTGVLIVDTHPESEAVLQLFDRPLPFEAGDIIFRIDQNRVENLVDLVITLLGTSKDKDRVRFVCLKGYGISSERNTTGAYPLRLPPACLEDLRRIHASLSSKDNEGERGE